MPMKKFLLFLILPLSLSAQHDHDAHPSNHGDVPAKTGMMHDSMSHAFSRNLPMSRNGSGTSWLPDKSAVYGYMFHREEWHAMFTFNKFLRYTNQNFNNAGMRGGQSFNFLDWAMLMGQRNVGEKGLFHFSGMVSLDPWFVRGSGYPLLYQTGENWEGSPIVDHQHPHDLFMELSVSYAHSFTKKVDAFVYFGLPGEPAIGSVAYMHRPSAMYNPDAPVTHHWNDATHITFGVATFGLRLGPVKLEASSFTGREPDDNRFNFDKPSFDSWSARLSFSPREDATFQVSHAQIHSPDVLHPHADINRTTASVIFYRSYYDESFFNGMLMWAQNYSEGIFENAALVEGSFNMNRLTIYSRYELVQKSAEHLQVQSEQFQNPLYLIHDIVLGVNVDFLKNKWVTMAAGTQLTFYVTDDELDPYYGSDPISLGLYLRIYPPKIMN
jgi:hypothetical protein